MQSLAGERLVRAGWDRAGRQVWRCAACGRLRTERSGSAFRGYRLSYAEVAEWLAERSVTADPSTIVDWAQTFTPLLVEAAQKHRQRVGARWRVDETLLKSGGRWRCLFRASDERGQVIDGYLSDRRDAAAALTFFERALAAAAVAPERVTSDKAKRCPPALRADLPAACTRPTGPVRSRPVLGGLHRVYECMI